MDPFDNPRARHLLNAMIDASDALVGAEARYRWALDIARDQGWSAKSITVLKQVGRDYAEAVTRYSNAAMAWLTYADRHSESSKPRGPINN